MINKNTDSDKTLEEKAQDLAWEVSKRPSTYIWFVRAINKVAVALGWVLSLFKRS